MAKTELPGKIETKGQRMLPRVTLSNGKTYFIDERLRQLRNIENPHDYIDDLMEVLSSEDRETVQTNVHRHVKVVTVSCGECGRTLFTGTEKEARRLRTYCLNCPGKR